MIDWKESGGPPVQPPSRRGFGTTIIERSIPFDLKGDAELRFDLLGVQARFVIPANYVEMVTSMSGVTTTLETETPAPPRLSGTALIVEDNLIIAMAAEVILLELGARHVETAASVNQALKSIDREKPEFRAARPQPRQREQHPGRQEADRTEGAVHVRHRLWRARADPGRTGCSAGGAEAVHARGRRSRARPGCGKRYRRTSFSAAPAAARFPETAAAPRNAQHAPSARDSARRTASDAPRR